MSEDSYALKRSKRIMQAVADDEWDDVDADACVALAEAIIAQDAELRALRLSSEDVARLRDLAAWLERKSPGHPDCELLTRLIGAK